MRLLRFGTKLFVYIYIYIQFYFFDDDNFFHNYLKVQKSSIYLKYNLL